MDYSPQMCSENGHIVILLHRVAKPQREGEYFQINVEKKKKKRQEVANKDS